MKESTALHTWDRLQTNCGHSLQNYDSKIAHTYHTVKFSGPNSCPETKLKLGKMYCDLYRPVGQKLKQWPWNTLRIFERKIMGQIYGLIKRREQWKMSVNNKLKDIFQGDDTVKLIGSLEVIWFGHIERMQSQRIPKEIATTTMEGRRKRRIPHKMWRDEVQKEGLIKYAGNT